MTCCVYLGIMFHAYDVGRDAANSLETNKMFNNRMEVTLETRADFR